MGKVGKCLRGLFRLNKTDGDASHHHHEQKPPLKKKWSFAMSKSNKETDRQKSQHDVVRAPEYENEASKRAIAATAAATAAVAEAAVAAAQAAAVVVRLTSSGRYISTATCVSQLGGRHANRREWAAVVIQSHFRAYLSKRALRALKALVKIQALVKGHLVRKKTADAMRRLRALVRAQMRARAGRALMMLSDSPQSTTNSSHFNHPRNGRLWELGGWSVNLSLGSDQICPTYSTSKNSTTMTARQSTRSLSYGEVQSLCPLKFAEDVDQSPFCTADSSPAFCSASSRGGSSKKGEFTPTKSDGYLSSYSDHPNYMSYTESSKAKVRSLSAPRQRSHYERSNSNSSSMKRYSVHGYGDSRPTQRVSALHPNFTNSAYYFA